MQHPWIGTFQARGASRYLKRAKARLRTPAPPSHAVQWRDRRRLATRGRALHVPVLNLDEIGVLLAEVRAQVLRDHDRAVAPSGAPDRHDEVGLALAHVL